MLAVQEYLIANGLDKLVSEFHIRTNADGSLVQLNYDMIDSPRGNPIVDSCRGIILDSAKDWKVIAYPFYRFYNEGEGPAATVNLDSSVLYEKLDGTMICLYWHPYRNKWQAATRGRILADGEILCGAGKVFGGGVPKTFDTLFWEAAKKYPKLMSNFSGPGGTATMMFHAHRFNLVFELIGPYNRILTKYDELDIRLLMVRELDTRLHEFNEYWLKSESYATGVPLPKVYSFKTHDDIIKIFESFKPTEEGFVLVDTRATVDGGRSFSRVKIKNPRYLALHHLLGAGEGELMSAKRIVTLIRSGDAAEIISYFPEYADKIKAMEDKFKGLGAIIDSTFATIKDLPSRKEFAEQAKKTPIPGAMFALLDKKVDSGHAYLLRMSEESLLDVLKSESTDARTKESAGA